MCIKSSTSQALGQRRDNDYIGCYFISLRDLLTVVARFVTSWTERTSSCSLHNRII